jgi:dUTP pyrophosphatase
MENTDIIINDDDNYINTMIKYKKLNELAKEPKHGSADAAGYDLYAATAEDISIPAHTTVKIDTGLAFALPKYTFGAIFARSGLATKQGLRPSNCVGVVDADYRGPVIVALHNDTDQEQIVSAGDRIAQLVLLPYLPMSFIESDNLDETERGDGGFGSTGLN